MKRLMLLVLLVAGVCLPSFATDEITIYNFDKIKTPKMALTINNFDPQEGFSVSNEYFSDFVNQSAQAKGGVFDFNDNKSPISIYNVQFENNKSTGSMFALGGAIFSSASDVSISNTIFNGNAASSTDGASLGGAIFADGAAFQSAKMLIENTDFKNNFASGGKDQNSGGAIAIQYYSDITINNSNFTNNYVASPENNQSTSFALGGAIAASKFLSPIGPNYNAKQHLTIKNSTFDNNYITSNQKAYGGAIGAANPDNTVYAIDLDITNTTFTNNHIIGGTASKGGAIATVYNYAPSSNVEMNILNSLFENNYLQGSADGRGGAIYSQLSTMKIENTDFINNKIEDCNIAYGGAISTVGSDMTFKNSNFIGNSVSGTSAFGGAIFFQGNGTSYLGMLNLIADGEDVEFTGNTANGKSDAIYAGANSRLNINAAEGNKVIFNDSISSSSNNVIMNINQNIAGKPTGGGLILNANMDGYVGEVNLYGGTIILGENGGLFNNSSKFTSNDGSTLDLRNGKISQSNFNNLVLNGTTNLKIDADLQAKTTDTFNVTTNSGSGSIHIADIDLINEMSDSDSRVESDVIIGGSSISTTLDKTLSTIFTQTSKYDVAINGNTLSFDKSGYSGGLVGAVETGGDRQFQMSGEEIVTGWNAAGNQMQGDNLVIKGNHNSIVGVDTVGVELSNSQNLLINCVGSTDKNNNIENAWSGFSSENGGAINNLGGIVTIIDSVIAGNQAENNGGAINNESGTVNIIADGNNVIFANNTANNQSNAIHTDGGTINLNASADKAIIFNDKITSEGINGLININGESSTVGTLENAPTGGTVVLNNDMSGYKGDVNLHHGTIKVGTNGTFFAPENFNIYGCSIDFANGVVQNANLGNLTISQQVDLMVDADLARGTMDTISASNVISDAGKIHISNINLLSDAVGDYTKIQFTDSSLKDTVVYDGGKVSYSPIFKYNVAYDQNTGNFDFMRFGGGTNTSERYNPAVLVAPVAAQIGSYLNQLNSYDIAFNNVDMYMLMTKEQRQTLKLRNKAAAANGNITFSPLTSQFDSKGLWFKPYSTFENVPLKNGPNVSNVSYGSYFGGDSELKELGHGWDGMFSVYAGYNGSHQTFNHNSIYQNGGLLGATGVAYKGNFFSALTANVGANSGNANTMFGSDYFTMLTAGIASKSGYNWQLADGKFIVQPNFLMSYSFVNTFNYTNAAGVSISSDPINAIQIAPGVRFIGNLKHGWQPYLGVTMVWNIIDETKFQANNVALPQMSIKPYISYGVGLQKRAGERFIGFVQAMINNGGRNGVSLSFGLRWAIGKDPKKTEHRMTKQVFKTPVQLNLSCAR